MIKLYSLLWKKIIKLNNNLIKLKNHLKSNLIQKKILIEIKLSKINFILLYNIYLITHRLFKQSNTIFYNIIMI